MDSIEHSLGLLAAALFAFVAIFVGVLHAVLGLAAYWLLESHIIDMLTPGDADEPTTR